jgi:hypothetical protein
MATTSTEKPKQPSGRSLTAADWREMRDTVAAIFLGFAKRAEQAERAEKSERAA